MWFSILFTKFPPSLSLSLFFLSKYGIYGKTEREKKVGEREEENGMQLEL